jgi:diadenylate cyclase
MIHSLRWQDIVDILLVSFLIYRAFLLIKGTRAIQLIVGFIIILFVFYLSKKLEFFTMGWILDNFVGSIIIVIVVIFQNDIRRMLLALGRSTFFKRISYLEQTLFYDELANACTFLGNKKTGALIVIEREIGLEEFMEIGMRVDADVNAELIMSIFHRESPLHDGALIIREGRIRAAGCILPITLKEDIDKALGTRHRAAIGITEVTDAVSLVVSEERGKVSYALRGEIVMDVAAERLKKVLKELLG